VYLKDKQEKEEIAHCVTYNTPRGSREKERSEENWVQDWTLKEHKTETEAITKKAFTRSQRASSLSQQNKSALADHVAHDNHVINWPADQHLG